MPTESPASHAFDLSSCSIVSLAERPDLHDRCEQIGGDAWPEFMLHDPVALQYWPKLIEYFPEFQFIVCQEDRVVAVANTAPFRFEAPLEDLPDRGVDWGVMKSVADYDAGATPNVVMGVQVVVDKRCRGRGLSAVATRAMLRQAALKGAPTVLAPVRPSQKHAYPLIPLEDYVAWTNPDGLPFDGWLRVHVRLGGKVVRVCPRSMEIRGSVRDWETWTGMTFPGSGAYIVDGALTPVSVNRSKDEVVYVEPNVWVAHRP